MIKTKLNALGIEADLPENIHFYDDGFISDLKKHSAELCKKYSSSLIQTKEGFFEFSVGNCSSFHKNNQTFVHIYYKNLIGAGQNIFNRGHEETHALVDLGQLYLLENLVKTRRLDVSPFRSSDEEFIADIGGLCALNSQHNQLNKFDKFLVYAQNCILGYSFKLEEWMKKNKF